MGLRWLLPLLCISYWIVSSGELRVDESRTRLLLEKEPAQVLLAVENSTGAALNAKVELKLLDPNDRVIAQVSSVQSIGIGSRTLNLSLPLKQEDRRFLWQRLHYRLSTENVSTPLAQGLISLSEITPDLFGLRVSASELAREGSRYKARVMASHPVTNKPAANVRINAELTLEDDDERRLTLRNITTTDADGIALLDFVMPKRFPQFPHTVHPSGGELKVVGQRGAFVAEAKGDALVDQFIKTLITTDKPLYQPGQMMHLRALIFTPSRRALANHDILFRIDDPEGTVVHRDVVKSSRFGVASTDWSIPENVRLGDYQVHVSVSGNTEDEDSSETTYEVRISRYDLPNFSVNIQSDHEYYLPGQNAEVRIRADYLFGQPVKRGHVRVVRESEREWNYRDQKWEVKEGEKQEGETDANGSFIAHLDLSDNPRGFEDFGYGGYRDVTYAAYFTDPTTNRTEQRRFDLRITKEPIHVYIINNNYGNRSLPLRFYVSTVYADGTPVSCNVSVTLANILSASKPKQQKFISRQLLTLRTNRYGLAKVSGVRLPREFEQLDEFSLKVSATDSSGRTGTRSEDLYLNDNDMMFVETSKTLYRAGEPLKANITSSNPDAVVVVDLTRDSSVIRSQRVRLHNGRASVTFPYTREFYGRLTIAASPALPKDNQSVEMATILYPRDVELKVKARTSQTTYRPGENAHVTLDVRAAEGSSAESVLGVVVSDKAVAERYRTAQEFGGNGASNDSAIDTFMGLDLELAGVTLRDLQHLNPAKAIAPELDLVAEVLLNKTHEFSPQYFGGDEYDTRPEEIFSRLIDGEMRPVKDALNRRYLSKIQFPTNESSLRRILSEEKIDLDRLLDPWGVPYKPIFTLEGPADVLVFLSAGPDKRFDTNDDFAVERFSWQYFLQTGAAIDRAIRQYHQRTGGFIRDIATLREELVRSNVFIAELRDRWGQPYKYDFSIRETHYVLTISSSGPDKVFSTDQRYRGDDFEIWIMPIDFFADERLKIEQILDNNFKNAKKFPQNERELSDVLRNTGSSLDALRDPWGRPYYATFFTKSSYADRTQLDNRGPAGQTPAPRVTITPVTRTTATVTLHSVGPDGVSGTRDDFSVGGFSMVVAEQIHGDRTPQPPPAQMVLSGGIGAIHGTVTDVNGAIIYSARVTARLMMQERSYETTSGEEGKYVIVDLPPGRYEVLFDAPGFKKTIVTDVTVAESNATEVSVALEAGEINEMVKVTSGGAPLNFSTGSRVNGLPRFRGEVIEARVSRQSGNSAAITTPHLREYFPETLFWQPSLETDKQGRAKINFKLADNITTWKLAVLGSTADGRVGATETEIKAFQPFFVDHDPPRVLTEGDEISLPVVVRNYLQQTQRVDLDLKPESWFSLLGPAQKRTSVAAGDASRETFTFRAVASIKDGKQRITANAADANDAIEKPVTVHPDGEELSVTDSEIFSSSSELQLTLPENMIRNSSEGEVKIYPNLTAHVIESVEAIMKRPYGCAEQVISSAYPSLLLLRQGKVNGTDLQLRPRAERYLSLGYGKLLNYRDESGGFTYWGHGKPDVALTAYALRFLTDASEFISVDADVISKAEEWLIKQQQADGSWPADYWDRDKRVRAVIRTAYIARVLSSVRGEESNEKTEALKRSLDYLGHRAAEIDEPYLLASYALALLNLGDAARAKPIVEKLFSMALREGSTTYWALETNTPFYGWGQAGRVETTALVVQALTKYCNSSSAKCETDSKSIDRALLFLLKHKDRYGVWYSTQATVNVLDALLSLLGTQPVRESVEATADIFVNEQLAQTIRMPAANRLISPITVDISKFLHTGKNTIRIKRPEGSPVASVQALASFYGPWPEVKPFETQSGDLRLQTKCDKTEGNVGDEITCHVEAERIAFRGYGMMMAEIGIPPGAEVDRSSLESAMKGSEWIIDQYDVLPDRVMFYLWPQAGGAKFDFKFRPRFGLKAQSAASVVYDYYNPEARTVVPPATFKIK